VFEDQSHSLEERLKHARAKEAVTIFVSGHHPWFLRNGEEKEEDSKALSPCPVEWGPREDGFPDCYFVVWNGDDNNQLIVDGFDSTGKPQCTRVPCGKGSRWREFQPSIH
jgi:hypothetical protein